MKAKSNYKLCLHVGDPCERCAEFAPSPPPPDKKILGTAQVGKVYWRHSDIRKEKTFFFCRYMSLFLYHYMTLVSTSPSLDIQHTHVYSVYPKSFNAVISHFTTRDCIVIFSLDFAYNLMKPLLWKLTGPS